MKNLIYLLLISILFIFSCEEETDDVTSIKITSPSHGDTFTRGESVTIRWEAEGPVEKTYCVVNGTSNGVTSSSSGSFRWSAYSTMVGGAVFITARAMNPEGKEAYNKITVYVND